MVRSWTFQISCFGVLDGDSQLNSFHQKAKADAKHLIRAETVKIIIRLRTYPPL